MRPVRRLRWGQSTRRFRRGDSAARCCQCGFTGLPLHDLFLARQYADRAKERLERYGDSGHAIRHGVGPGLTPVHDIGFGENIAQEAETRRDHGIAVFVRRDIDQRHRQHVAAFRTFDMNRPSHRMHKGQVHGQTVIGDRFQCQIAVQRIARLEDDEIARICAGHRRDRRVIAVEAIRIVDAVLPGLGDDNLGFPGLVRGVGQRRTRTKRRRCGGDHDMLHSSLVDLPKRLTSGHVVQPSTKSGFYRRIFRKITANAPELCTIRGHWPLAAKQRWALIARPDLLPGLPFGNALPPIPRSRD